MNKDGDARFDTPNNTLPIGLDDTYEHRALEFVQLQGRTDPEGILRKGLIEEIGEILSTDPADRNELTKEIGDVLWYLYAIPSQRGLSFTLIAEVGSSLDDTFTKLSEKTDELPIIHPEDNQSFDRTENPASVLAFDALRFIDTLNPKSPEVWHDVEPERQHNLEASLRAVFVSLGNYAQNSDISLDAALERTLEKLATRQRKPHVINEVDKPHVESMRELLLPALGTLAFGLATRLATTEERWLEDDEREYLPNR